MGFPDRGEQKAEEFLGTGNQGGQDQQGETSSQHEPHEPGHR